MSSESSSRLLAPTVFSSPKWKRKLESPLSAAVHQVVLGSQEFVEKIRAMLGGRQEERDVPQLRRFLGEGRPGLEEVLRLVAEHYGADRTTWMPGKRTDGLARAVAAYIARRVTGLSARAIADGLGYRSAHGVSVACHRVERAMRVGRLAEEIRGLIERLGTNY